MASLSLPSLDTGITAPGPLQRTTNHLMVPYKIDGYYPGFNVVILHGVVWFRIHEEWQDLPNELWAWKHVTVWTTGHYYYGRSIWVPSRLSLDFWEHNHDQAMSPHPRVLTSVIDHQSIPSVTAIIAPRLFGILRSYGDSRLSRTCRLVCRDWAKACSIADPEWCNLQYKDGAVWYHIEEEWRHLPSKYWAWFAWSSRNGELSQWWLDRPPGHWGLQLVQPVDDSVRRSPRYYPSTLPVSLFPSGTSRQSVHAIAAALPPELFKYICNAADRSSSSSRLVCRYWHRQCTPRVFEMIDVKRSPERIRALWRHRMEPPMRSLKVIEGVPYYNKESKFPWLHLLTQTCAYASNQSAWKVGNHLRYIAIEGPFAGGHQTIRSVHFALPRPLPRSLSRGIKILSLSGIHFRQFEDLTHLVCELPDLEVLDCCWSSFDSFPIELPRRRHRTNRNKLSKLHIKDEHGLSVSTLYLSVYNEMSFFSESEIVVVLALLQLPFVTCFDTLKVQYEDNPHDHCRRLVLDTDFKPRLEDTMVILTCVRDETQNHARLIVVFDFSWRETDEDFDCWWQFDTKLSNIEGLMQRVECVFGFYDDEQMVRFGEIVGSEMPSISQRGAARYSVKLKHDSSIRKARSAQWNEDHPDGWYQASLESEELTGTAKKELAEVYS